ncbi:MAG: hypothetical protein FJZ95_04810 [Chloroflexi bacterium]|nr:hypothetical protein [Chloroflexota bacterium]
MEQGLRVFLNATKTGIAKPKATLGKLLSLNSDKIGYDLFHKIDTLNKLVYGRTKHDFKIAAPREQLLSLVESLVIYFVSRRIAVELLTECGVANQIADDLRKAENGQDGVFIGQTWSI